MRWTWDELQRAAAARTVTVDIHCVTKWSKLDTALAGRVGRHAPRRAVDHDADYALAFCDGGYTTNLPRRGRAAAARRGSRTRYDGEPLEPEHGGPARLLVPHLYFWKSAKWVRGLRLPQSAARRTHCALFQK